MTPVEEQDLADVIEAFAALLLAEERRLAAEAQAEPDKEAER